MIASTTHDMSEKQYLIQFIHSRVCAKPSACLQLSLQHDHAACTAAARSLTVPDADTRMPCCMAPKISPNGPPDSQ